MRFGELFAGVGGFSIGLEQAGWKCGWQSVQSHHAQTFIAGDMQVRRLTPNECERLMGWPDDHTLHRADGKQNSDTTRYKMCGNGVASPVARWIAEQINQVERGV